MTDDGGEFSYLNKIIQSTYIGLPKVVFTFGAGHPFDLVKTKLQANPNIQSGVLLSKEIFKRTGIKGFYTGGIPNFSRALLKEAYRNPLRGGIMYGLNKSLPEQGKSSKSILTGISMAIADSIIICPLERLKVWLMTNNNIHNNTITKFFVNRDRQHPSILQDTFKGVTVSMTRSTVSWVSYLLAESKIRETVINYSPRVDCKDPKLPLFENLLVGSLGGIVNCICTLPFDTIKTNVQKEGAVHQATFKTMYDIGRNLVSSHGFVKGLYPGFLTRLIHYSIVGIITSNVIQQVDRVWQEGASQPNVLLSK